MEGGDGVTELVVLDNPDVEVASVVDLDTFTPLAIVAAGPSRRTLLDAFIDSTPFDPTVLDPDSIRAAFQSFLSRMADAAADTPQDEAVPVGDDTGISDDDRYALAEREAANTPGAPEPQPADTDEPERGAVALVKVQCWNCNGSGVIRFGGDDPDQACNMCQGRGWVEQPGVA